MKPINMPPYPSKERQIAAFKELKIGILDDMIFMEKSLASGDSRHLAKLIKARSELKRVEILLSGIFN